MFYVSVNITPHLLCSQDNINLFNVFHVFILYIFPHHISLVTISVSVYMLIFLYFFTSTHKFFKLLYIFVG